MVQDGLVQDLIQILTIAALRLAPGKIYAERGGETLPIRAFAVGKRATAAVLRCVPAGPRHLIVPV